MRKQNPEIMKTGCNNPDHHRQCGSKRANRKGYENGIDQPKEVFGFPFAKIFFVVLDELAKTQFHEQFPQE